MQHASQLINIFETCPNFFHEPTCLFEIDAIKLALPLVCSNLERHLPQPRAPSIRQQYENPPQMTHYLPDLENQIHGTILTLIWTNMTMIQNFPNQYCNFKLFYITHRGHCSPNISHFSPNFF